MMINQKLDTFIDEVRTGKREGSVVTNRTTGSLSADEKEAWRQLRKELESVGITPALFNQHRELVIERLLKAIDDGNLVEDIGEELSDTATNERLDTGDPVYHHEDLTEEPGEELSHGTQESTEESGDIGGKYSSHKQESAKGRLAAAGPTYRTTLKAGIQGTKTSLINPSATRSIRGPSRIVKLLFRITNSSSRIIVAAEQGDKGLVQELLRRGANVDSKDRIGRTPLSRAAANGHEAVVQLLLATGQVEIDSKDRWDQTPLSWAAANGHEAVVQLLQTFSSS
jgi:hypothetical protein